jgi:hypothetical protein
MSNTAVIQQIGEKTELWSPTTFQVANPPNALSNKVVSYFISGCVPPSYIALMKRLSNRFHLHAEKIHRLCCTFQLTGADVSNDRFYQVS